MRLTSPLEIRRRIMKGLMSVVEAAGLLGISQWTVRAYIREGKLRPVRLGRRVLLTEDELERLVTENKAQEPQCNEMCGEVRNA